MGLKESVQDRRRGPSTTSLKKPRVPRSLLNKYRDGLLLTSACEAGELYRAIVDGTSYEELKKIAPPTTTFWRSSRWATMPTWCGMARWTARRIKEFNRTVIKLGEDLHKPVIATGDVLHTRPEDAIYRAVFSRAGSNWDADNQPPLFFRTIFAGYL